MTMSDIDDDREDFTRFLAEYGLSRSLVRNASYNPNDQIPMPDWGEGKLQLGHSDIQRYGMFATETVAFADLLAPARIDGKRTPAGVFTNHSCTPNAHYEAHPDGDLDLVASQNIDKGEEVTLDYRQAASVNRLQPDRLEVTETMRQRLVRLKVEQTTGEIDALVDVALQRFGYLPSFPAFLSLIPDPA
jgi:hypothetical protein